MMVKTARRVGLFQRAVAAALLLYCGNEVIGQQLPVTQEGEREGNSYELRGYIGQQVGGIQKLVVPPDNASIPVPPPPPALPGYPANDPVSYTHLTLPTIYSV